MPAGLEDTFDLGHDPIRMLGVFEHSVAFNAIEDATRKRKLFCVGGYVDTGEREKIEVYIPFGARVSATDVEVPPAQRRVDRVFARVVPDGGWRQQPV